MTSTVSRPPAMAVGIGTLLLTSLAAAGVHLRAEAIRERIRMLEDRAVSAPAVPAPPPVAAPAAAPESVSAALPGIAALRREVEECERLASIAGGSEPGAESPVVTDPAGAPAAGPASAGKRIDPRIRLAARQEAERMLAKEESEKKEKERELKAARRKEMMADFELFGKMFLPTRALKTADKLMKRFNIAEEQRPKVEAAITKMTATLGTAFDAAKKKLESMPEEATADEIHTTLMSRFGMVFMGAVSAASRTIKESVPPDQATEVGNAVMEALQPDAEERSASGVDGEPGHEETPPADGGDGPSGK